MALSDRRSLFWQGARGGVPFALVIGPLAMLFGVVASEAGLNIAETMGFCVLVIAGAAQFTAVQLMTENTPTLIVIATSLAVNLRMALYSAALTPYFGPAPGWQRAILCYFLIDQSYAVSATKFETEPELPLSHKISFFLGIMVPILPLWYGMTYLGAVLGAQIPPEYGLDFALPITFLALNAPAVRSIAHLAAAVCSVIAALAFAWLPYGMGLLVAAGLAMGTGAMVEVYLERRAQ